MTNIKQMDLVVSYNYTNSFRSKQTVWSDTTLYFVKIKHIISGPVNNMCQQIFHL